MQKVKIKMTDQNSKSDLMEKIISLCKRRGFVFPGSEIYGGLANSWDYGPLGAELRNNIKQLWWNRYVHRRDDIVGLEAAIIMNPKVWEQSGHVATFNDLLIECKGCHQRFDQEKMESGKCPLCGKEKFTEPKLFNTLFKTFIGTVEDAKSTAYLRPETAQGMFMDFKLVQQTSRMQLPFGIAQIGRCFRNEISPRDFLFRSREFHIGEFEFFIHPDEKKCELLDKKHLDVKFRFLSEESQKSDSASELKEVTIKEIFDKKKLDGWHAYWLAEQIIWFKKLGLDEIKIREHTKEELSHYSSATFDIDYEYPFGSKEVAGIANRGQFDLIQHQKESKESFEIFDEKTKNKVVPRVIEPTFGMERVFLALLTKAYTFDSERDNVVLKLPPRLAPIKAAVFPIVKKPEFEKISEEIVKDLKKYFNVVYDRSGSIGRRYSRNDEIGTPYCITIDEKSETLKYVTIRNRDDTKQIRVKIKNLSEILKKLINDEIEFEKAGKIVKTRVK